MKKILIAAVTLCSAITFGQGSTDYGNGLKLNLNPEGNKFIRFIAWNQVWMRSSQLNPGTMIGDASTTTQEDISLRRLRILAYAQISPRYMIVTHFGINNQTFTNGGAAGTSGTGGYGAGKKPGLFFHDAWNEYAVVLPKEGKPFSLSIGAGLHYYMGLSRMTMASTLNFLTIDAPIFNWPLIDNSDQFARQVGIFAKGKYNKLEYRFSLNKPFSTNIDVLAKNPSGNYVNAENTSFDNSGNTKWSKAGYVEYQFLDKEANLLPFKVGTYLGTKKVFNIGAGFYTAPNGTRSRNSDLTVSKHDINLFSGDVFLDMPIGAKEKKMALTAYSVYYNYNFGPNYLRNIGIMNEGIADATFTGAKALAGPGNAQPMIGTGSIWYTQAGFLIPNKNEKPKVRIQPYLAYTNKNFDALKKSSNQFDLGTNLFLDGHHAKLTAQYSNRPVYTTVDHIDGYKGEFLLQLQVYL
jgi:hypothetical protein